MKKIIATILIFATFLISVPTVMAEDIADTVTILPSDMPNEPLDMITINVVDKNDVPVSNARVEVESTEKGKLGKWFAHYGNRSTDRMGKIRLYDRVPFDQGNISKNGTYKISVTMQSANGKYSTEKFTSDLSKLKNGDEYTIKLKGKDTKKDVEKAKDRVDIFIKNSKGGAVKNMKIQIFGHSNAIPLTNGTVSSKENQSKIKKCEGYPEYYPVNGLYEGYTDKNGRLTFPNLDKDTYGVTFSWKGGLDNKDDIKVTNKAGVKEFHLTFDESLLDK